MSGSAAPVPLAALAALLADDTRARFCLALLDGRAWSAGRLAAHAGVAASTASEHLSRLVEGGLLAQERRGRHRYVRLASPQVAQLVEDLTAHALAGAPGDHDGHGGDGGDGGHDGGVGSGAVSGTGGARPGTTLRAASAARAMARARTCYDHLAGRLGVAVTDALLARGLLCQEGGFALSDAGRGWFAAELGARLPAGGRRPLVRPCLDWTERRPHLAGTAGAVLCATALERGWVRRIGSGRALAVSPAGHRALERLLGLSPDHGATPARPPASGAV
ncbi:winged helix-turn-helix domain-containing protein [Streptosporangium sp. NPDC023615]|uniref:ArsR/SmtB family transcription factor n=1 Tax=Streptosporangium sp. NPDC023615 TaxID=3154794 RepID=UPI003437F5FE